jgi:hypothetical protein
LFCNDDLLLDAMQARSLSTVLCVGSGLSVEPRALAAAGLDVTALDLSPYAMWCAPTLDVRRSGRFFDQQRLRAGGRVRFVAGDLMGSAVGPGPYDVIIELLRQFAKRIAVLLGGLCRDSQCPLVLVVVGSQGRSQCWVQPSSISAPSLLLVAWRAIQRHVMNAHARSS